MSPAPQSTAANDSFGSARSQGAAARAWYSFERMFDRLFGRAANPLRQLGALGFFCFWLVLASGAYVYAFFDTSVAGAYDSLESLANEQRFAGGVMRSLHRYASDAFIVFMALHLVREWAYGRFHGFRWFSWLSGIPLAWLALISGLVGYWLVWDVQGQYVATTLTELAAVLPGFDAAIVRNAVAEENVSDRLFSLLLFAHIAVSLLLLLGMWLHLHRLARAQSRPNARVGWSAAFTLLLLCLAVPALSQPRADLAAAPPLLSIDWFYLFALPPAQLGSPAAVWAVLLGGTFALAVLPWLFGFRRAPSASVDPRNCNGCGRCLDDCPYEAIALVPREQRLAGMPLGRSRSMAVVDKDACASCGLCAGACPFSTPFRSTPALRSGIELPQLAMAELRARLEQKISALQGSGTVVVFGCGDVVRGAGANAGGPGVGVLSLPCVGMLPPSFIDYALRCGAGGVLLAGCGGGDCEFRFGDEWTRARLAGQREPHLRSSVSRERVHAVWLHRDRGLSLLDELDAFRARLAAMAPRKVVLPRGARRSQYA